MTADANSKTYAIIPGPEMGVVSIDYLEKLAQVARKHEIPLVKITSAQRFAFAGFPADSTEAIRRDMGLETLPGKPVGIHYIQACPGSKWCKFGQQDSLALGAQLKKALMAKALPAKTKVGVSGCPMNCCEGFIRDLGIFGKKKGWTLVFGGNGGGVPRIGEIIAEGLNEAQVMELAEKCLDFYAAHARKKERSARFMERTPVETLKAALGC
jgi:NAD(P)H-nitrite reductase large subunit